MTESERNRAPVVSIQVLAAGDTATPTRLAVTATDDGRIATYAVQWGDNTDDTAGSGVPGELSHQYAAAGSYDVTVEVHDNKRALAAHTVQIDVPEHRAPLTLHVEDLSAEVDGPTPVDYPPPAVSGGLNPVVTFDPPEGSYLTVGDTVVTATASSEDGQSVATTFLVHFTQRAEPPVETGGDSEYLTTLKATGKLKYAWSLRSKASVDAMPSQGGSENRWPVTFDADMGAMLQRATPGDATAPYRGASMTQKQPKVSVLGTSAFITWDWRLNEDFRWLKDTARLFNYKAWRFDFATIWFAEKLWFNTAANRGKGIAEVKITTQSGKYVAPPSTRLSDETIMPTVGEFYAEGERWNRSAVWIDGVIGGPGAGLPTATNPTPTTVGLHVWHADEQRDPVQVLNGARLYSPLAGLQMFRCEHNTSQDPVINKDLRIHTRDLAILTNVTRADVEALLARPKA